MVEGVGHRTGDGGQSVGVAAEGDGFLDAVDIVCGVEEADDCRANRAGAGGIEGIAGVDIGVGTAAPFRVVLGQNLLLDLFLPTAVFQVIDRERSSNSAFDSFRMIMGWRCCFMAKRMHSSSLCASHPAEEHRIAEPLPKLP